MDDVSLVSKLFAASDRDADRDGSISRDELVAFFSELAAESPDDRHTH